MQGDVGAVLSQMRVLYVEDSDDVRQFVAQLLKRRVKELLVAEDGEVGEALYFEHKPDVVITDVTMPKKDGLSMSAAIKEHNKDVPIILATAHNEEERFLQAIEIGIDKYIIKPIDPRKLIEAIESVAMTLHRRKMAEEYRKKLALEEINSAARDMFTNIYEASPNPTVAYSGDELFFINNAFANFLDAGQLSALKNGTIKLDGLFMKKEGFKSSISELTQERPTENKVSIKTEKGRKIFYVVPREISGNSCACIVYTLNDITLYEYQRLKLKQYSDTLQELIYKKVYNKPKDEAPQKPVVTQVVAPKAVEQKNVEVAPEELKAEKESISVDAAQMKILRKSHKNKLTADEYVNDIGESMLDELDELADLESEIKELADELKSDFKPKYLEEISAKLDRVSAIINLFFEFQDLSYAIRHLSTLVSDMQADIMDDKKRKTLQVYISTVTEEIGEWRRTIFVTREAVDIHYLDASLFGSCLQIELMLQDKKMDNDDDDLELF